MNPNTIPTKTLNTHISSSTERIVPEVLFHIQSTLSVYPKYSSIFCTTVSFTGSQRTWQVYSRKLGVQGRGHPRQMETHHRAQSHIDLKFSDIHILWTIQRSQSTYNTCLWKEETRAPGAQREHGNSTYTGRRQESKPQHWRSEASEPPCLLLLPNNVLMLYCSLLSI